MTQNEKAGCLGAILQLFGLGAASSSSVAGQVDKTKSLPYRVRDDFLSDGELAFFRALTEALQGRILICPKVRLADIVFTLKGDKWQSFQNKIDRKHMDFLLCDTTRVRILCGIELDDSSHQRQDRIDRDGFVEAVFVAASIPLVRFKAQTRYQPAEIRSAISSAISSAIERPQAPIANPTTADAPVCPKCGVPMVERQAQRGQNKGNRFFGCPNYPRCKETKRD